MGTMPFNWFDIFVLVFLTVGAFRGRKRGMSQEVIPLIKWITVAAVCGLFYLPLATEIANGTVISLLAASFTAYLGIALLIAVVFAVVNRQLGGKIVGSDAFGSAEYYLGIFSGIIRFACMLIFGLALLNARLYTSQEITERNKYVQQNFDNDFFPALFQIQANVFTESLTGPAIHKNLDFLLIKPAVPESKPLKRKELDLPV
jgi:uncharacterized membrane protein required for colicin V production